MAGHGAGRQPIAALASALHARDFSRADNARVVREMRRLITLLVALVLRVLRERVFECMGDPWWPWLGCFAFLECA